MSIDTPQWKQFWFEANMFSGFVNGPEDWHRLREAYPNKTDEELLNAQEATYNGSWTSEKKPNYGFRMEHDGERRLRDFFLEHNMLSLIPVRRRDQLLGIGEKITIMTSDDGRFLVDKSTLFLRVTIEPMGGI